MIQKSLNKIALLFITLLTSTLGLAACSRPSETHSTEEGKVSSTPKYTAALGGFQNLKGTPYLMSALTETGWRLDKSSSYESGNGGGQPRNLVFLDTNSLKSLRLFDTNAYAIVQTDQYVQKVSGKEVTQWLVHQVVKADTDNNKRLDQNDLKTLGISSASGKGYVEMLTGITDFFGLSMVTPGKLVVVYRKNKVKIASIIDLEKRTITATQPIVSLGTEVQ